MGIELTGAIALFWVFAGVWGLVYTPTRVLRDRRLARDARANLAQSVAVSTGINLTGSQSGTGTDDDGTGPGTYYLGKYRAGVTGNSDGGPGRRAVRRDHGGTGDDRLPSRGGAVRSDAAPVGGVDFDGE